MRAIIMPGMPGIPIIIWGIIIMAWGIIIMPGMPIIWGIIVMLGMPIVWGIIICGIIMPGVIVGMGIGMGIGIMLGIPIMPGIIIWGGWGIAFGIAVIMVLSCPMEGSGGIVCERGAIFAACPPACKPGAGRGSLFSAMTDASPARRPL
jgi:hypothetical protein